MQNSHNGKSKKAVFTGALLAGGHSRRMERDKALVPVDGQPLWHRGLTALQSSCAPVIIAGDRPDLATDAVPCFADAFPGSALAGLHTALAHAATDWVTVLPCDLPFPSPQLLRRLQQHCSDPFDAVVPRSRFGREPLIACYHRNALAQVEARLAAGRVKILDLLDELSVRYLDEEELPPGWRRALRNLNTPADLQAMMLPPPAVTFIAASGTGKTTLLEKLIAELTKRGWDIGALKHDAHRFEIDHEGKDSWRLARAGAAVTAISSPAQTAVIERHELAPGIEELLAPFAGKVDIVLTEGFKQSRLPKIEVHRAVLEKPLICRGERHDPTLVGVASDVRLSLDVPCFDLDDVSALATFIEEKFLT